MFKKVFSLLTCTAMITSLMCGCEKKDESSTEMYYGQTFKEVEGQEIYLIYDGRYIDDEQMSTVADYYHSIQTKDSELFKSTQSPQYIEFLEEKQSTDISEYIESTHESIAYELGEGFDYTQIEVIDCGDITSDNGINDIKELLDGIYEDAGMKKSFSETVKDEKYIIFDITAVNASGTEYNLTDEIRYIFTCEDGIYIF